MTLYAESSAILAWLLGEPRGKEVASALDGATRVFASDLTLLECERALIRAWSIHQISETERIDQSADLAAVVARWIRLAVGEEVFERACRPFPVEPVRSLDALHLASALTARAAASDVGVLTLDQRIRENAERLGFEVIP